MSHTLLGLRTKLGSQSTAVQHTARVTVRRKIGNKLSILTVARWRWLLSAHGPAVVGVELLAVEVLPVSEQHAAVVEPFHEELGVHWRPGQMARAVPAQPVQVQDIFVPQSSRPLPEEPDVQPAREEGQGPYGEERQAKAARSAAHQPAAAT
jgi:hypothetical protein